MRLCGIHTRVISEENLDNLIPDMHMYITNDCHISQGQFAK